MDLNYYIIRNRLAWPKSEKGGLCYTDWSKFLPSISLNRLKSEQLSTQAPKTDSFEPITQTLSLKRTIGRFFVVTLSKQPYSFSSLKPERNLSRDTILLLLLLVPWERREAVKVGCQWDWEQEEEGIKCSRSKLGSSHSRLQTYFWIEKQFVG